MVDFTCSVGLWIQPKTLDYAKIETLRQAEAAEVSKPRPLHSELTAIFIVITMEPS
jgi:hypothetical protein